MSMEIYAQRLIRLLQSIDQKMDYQNKLLESMVERKDEERFTAEFGRKIMQEQVGKMMSMFKDHPSMKANPDMFKQIMDNVNKQMGGSEK